ncbi:transglutaminase domain-containing protein [Paenibacillus kribbensis]|uniref:Transglutaminase n=1 Tax=Paenibacillus kribbensis TaxID=172713 RepID=A0A222WHR0_9BACL|nr:transglutaminase domain-containing protein [Paenibacillus kribbensis]ASR45929.1 transglutaminase [Paenibacillus kribbensis]
MNRKIGVKVVKCLVVGAALATALPQTMIWESVSAASVKAEQASSVQQLEGTILQAMLARNELLTFTYSGDMRDFQKQLQNTINRAMESDPYVNFILKTYTFNYTGTSTGVDVTIRMNFRESKAQSDYVDNTVQDVLSNIITNDMTDHEKVKAIHDWVVLNLKYDVPQQKYTAYEGLTTGSTVCQGYSLLTYRMLERAGIENRIVQGVAGGQDHTWNLVLLDGQWYHLDTTWDDPVPDRANVVNTSYYLLTDDELSQDHTWVHKYPAASTSYQQTLAGLIAEGGSRTDAYQKLYDDLKYASYGDSAPKSAREILELTRQAVLNGQSTVSFLYQGTERNLVQDLTPLYQLGIRNLNYQYTLVPSTGNLRVSITWTR